MTTQPSTDLSRIVREGIIILEASDWQSRFVDTCSFCKKDHAPVRQLRIQPENDWVVLEYRCPIRPTTSWTNGWSFGHTDAINRAIKANRDQYLKLLALRGRIVEGGAK